MHEGLATLKHLQLWQLKCTKRMANRNKFNQIEYNYEVQCESVIYQILGITMLFQGISSLFIEIHTKCSE